VKKQGFTLKDKKSGFSEDFPKEIRAAREKLKEELKQMKKEKKKATILYPAKLFVEGKVVREIPVFEDTVSEW